MIFFIVQKLKESSDFSCKPGSRLWFYVLTIWIITQQFRPLEPECCIFRPWEQIRPRLCGLSELGFRPCEPTKFGLRPCGPKKAGFRPGGLKELGFRQCGRTKSKFRPSGLKNRNSDCVDKIVRKPASCPVAGETRFETGWTEKKWFLPCRWMKPRVRPCGPKKKQFQTGSNELIRVQTTCRFQMKWTVEI